MKFENRTILITGGSAGIGLELAKQLVERQNKVIVTGRNIEKLKKIQKENPKIHIYQSDVSNAEAVTELFRVISESYPDLSVLINNAGIGRTIDLQEQQELPYLNEEIQINLQGPIAMINQFLPGLLKQPNAAIINVTSALAFSPYPIVPIYGATKAALHSFTASLRVQLRDTDVKVFELAPPTTQTEMLKGFGPKALRGVKVLSAETLASLALKSMEEGREEVCPGDAYKLKLMSRIAPQFILKKMSRSGAVKAV